MRSLRSHDVPVSATSIPGDLDDWAEDLARANVFASTQDFANASRLLSKWSAPALSGNVVAFDLVARTWMLRGDVARDQGCLVGPNGASSFYDRARVAFSEIGNARGAARARLRRAVVTEMREHFDEARNQYVKLSVTNDLRPRDRALALLWVGTTATKQRDLGNSIAIMSDALARIEALGEELDWCVAQQKLALAYRSAGRLSEAADCIRLAEECSGPSMSVLHSVRLNTAKAHILLSEPRTATEGQRVLDNARAMAVSYGLAHQRRAIETIEKAHG